MTRCTPIIAETAGHTPTPWLVSARAHFRIITEWGATVATVGSDSDLRDQWEANAAFIVEAVNNYASLQSRLSAQDKRVEELEKALRKIAEHRTASARGESPSYAVGWAFHNVRLIARSALTAGAQR